MSRILFALIALCLTSGPLPAQDGGNRPVSLSDLATILGRFDRQIGGCTIDQDLYATIYDHCRSLGGRIDHCRRNAEAGACMPPVVSPPDGGGPLADLPPFSGGDMQIFDPDLAGRTQGCQPPRPANIGCRVTCKPCITFVCNDGEWEAERIDFPDEICKPRGGGGGPDFTACPRSDTGFCPAECSVCF